MANLTRRTILGGATALPFITAPALAQVMQVAPPTDRTAWDRAMADFQAARDAEDAYNDGPYAAAQRRYERAAKAGTPEPKCEIVFTAEEMNSVKGPNAPERTEPFVWDWPNFYSARRFYASTMSDQTRGRLFDRRLSDLLASHEAWEAEQTALRFQTGLAAAGEEADRLCDIAGEAENRLMQTPAPDLAALLFKYGRVRDMCRDGAADWFASFHADLERFAAREARNG